ncbi:hypothetical protein ABEB36_000765 [Hypothenemus hampei]|uniref:Antistasin-like domain-containing protein n=1 Tax=Hypothenemus hampei TaxID=57062 RepID=A0ABD1FCF2_HYPHA
MIDENSSLISSLIRRRRVYSDERKKYRKYYFISSKNRVEENIEGTRPRKTKKKIRTKPRLAAPSIEACPPDSQFEDDTCICNPNYCTPPPCLSELKIAAPGNDIPGDCCPIYSCEGCKNETLLEGKCPCAPGAVLDERGVCTCVDKERHLVDGECKCNPQQCELPKICDKKSVLTIIEDGCCKKSRCVPCPQDSESTNLETDLLEDHCVCLPCSNDCGFNKTVVVKKKGTGFPGNCCDLYECKPLIEEKNKECVVGDIIYDNNEEWSTDDKQTCICTNGLSLCKPKDEELSLKNCYDEDFMYKHNQTWLKDKGCTSCICSDGELKCISHYCDSKESQIKQNSSQSCIKEKKNYMHLATWTESDECTNCTCLNGEITCTSDFCESKKEKVGECQPLFRCNKQCSNGFRINKRGCEICKCNPDKVIGPELLTKYNITYGDLLKILDEYTKNRASTSTTLAPTTTEKVTPVPTILIIRRNGDEKTVTSETMITPAYKEDPSQWILLAVLVVIVVIIAFGLLLVYCYRKRHHNYKLTPTRGSYHSVTSTTDNNNTIKKDSIRFDSE